MSDYKQYIIIPAEPEFVYLALTRADTIALWSGFEATMEAIPDSEFSLWEGSIVGRNISFEENHKIIQEWYFGDQPEQSIVTFTLHPHNKGTSLEVTHTNIPKDDYDDMVTGWKETYLANLKEFYLEE